MAIILNLNTDGLFCGDCPFKFPNKRNPPSEFTCDNRAFQAFYGKRLDDHNGHSCRHQSCLQAEVKDA